MTPNPSTDRVNVFPSTTAGHYWADKTTLRDLLPLTDKGAGATIGWRTQQYGNVIWTMKNASSSDGVTFTRDDVAVAARAIRHNADGSLDFLFAAAAANPITWVVHETLGPTGLLTIKAGAGLNFTTAGTVRIGTTDAFDVIFQRNGIDELFFLSGGAAKFASPIATGTTPATTGQIRLPNAVGVAWRNVANDADILGIIVDASNHLVLRPGAGGSVNSHADGGSNLGSAATRWASLFLSTDLRMGSGGLARMEAQNRFRHLNMIVRAFLNADLTVVTATQTVVNLVGETFDTDAMHDVVSNTNRLVAPIAGKYLVYAQATLFLGSDAATVSLRIRDQAAAVLALDIRKVAAVTDQRFNSATSTIVSLAAADWVELTIEHDAGIDRTLLSGSNTSFMYMQYLGE